MKLNQSIGLVKNDFSPNEIKIYQAYYALKKIESYSSNEDLEPLIDLVGKWRYYIGVKEELSKEEIFMNVTFIRENFGELNIVDINQAINLSLKGVLSVDVEHYQNFTPIYISRILRAYKTYRAKTMVDIRQRITEYKAKKSTNVSVDEKYKIAIENLKSMYESKDDKNFYDYGSIVYDFIKKNKLVTMTKESIDEAFNYGKKKSLENVREGFLKDVINSTSDNHLKAREAKERQIRSHARNFVVKKWLDSFSKEKWDNFLSKITPDMI